MRAGCFIMVGKTLPRGCAMGLADTPQDNFLDAGLDDAEAARRLADCATARIKRSPNTTWLRLFLAQWRSPIQLMLLASAGVALGLGDVIDAAIISAIMLVSALLGFWQ